MDFDNLQHVNDSVFTEKNINQLQQGFWRSEHCEK